MVGGVYRGDLLPHILPTATHPKHTRSRSILYIRDQERGTGSRKWLK